MKAIWNGMVVADSTETVLFDGDHYFPASAVRADCLLTSNRRSMCSVKGEARYHNLFVNGDVLPDGAWYYPQPREVAEAIAGRIAFGMGVRIED